MNKPFLKRALVAVATLAVGVGIVPLLTATPAAAAGSLVGPLTIKSTSGGADLQSGDSATTFTLRGSGLACPGDSTNDGFRWQAYMVSGGIDPSQLTFGSSGPSLGAQGPNTGTFATFLQPLYSTTGSPLTNQQTADKTPPGTTGPILSIDNMNFAVHAPGDIPAGVYNLGIACTNGPASATQMSSFWNVKMTISSDPAGGPAQIHWENGTAPDAPTIASVTPQAVSAGTGQASVAFSNPAANPSLTDCIIEVGTSPGGSEFSSGLSGSCVSPRVVTGLAYGTPYFFRVKSVNVVGTSADSNELGTTSVRPAVTGLSATPSPNTVALDWDDASLLGSDSYNVARCTLPATSPCTSASSGFVASVASADSAETFTGLTAGQVYAFTVTYGASGTSLASSVQSSPLSNSILLQDITVGRPNGALVLTQVCGKWDQMAAETSQFGYPNGLPLSAASATGTAPTTGASAGGPPDGEFNEYPYPENADGTANATYPTRCGIALGNAKLITKGGAVNGAGQFFAADGRLNQITVVDTRDTDPGWTINFTMSDLANAASSTAISGNQLGWTAQKTDTPAFFDGYGQSYDQTVNYTNQTLAPNGQGAAGAGTAHSVIQAPDATPGLGIATLDARIKLLIPIHAKNGNYSGTLTINAL